jgi:hypothetical protein
MEWEGRRAGAECGAISEEAGSEQAVAAAESGMVSGLKK